MALIVVLSQYRKLVAKQRAYPFEPIGDAVDRVLQHVEESRRLDGELCDHRRSIASKNDQTGTVTNAITHTHAASTKTRIENGRLRASRIMCPAIQQGS